MKPQSIPDHITALYLAAIIYDEKHFKQKLLKYYSPQYMKTSESETDFWAVVVINRQIWVAIRGTDGTSLSKWFKAWFSDFDARLTDKGRHTGFEIGSRSIVSDVVETIRYLYSNNYAYREKSVKITGHSRGSSEEPIVMYDIKKDLPEVCLSLEGYQFSAFPCGDERFRAEWERMAITGDLVLLRYVNPRDIASWNKFRKKNRLTPNGVDTPATEIILPPDTWWQRIFKRIPGIVEHRIQEFFDGFCILYPENKKLLKQMRREA